MNEFPLYWTVGNRAWICDTSLTIHFCIGFFPLVTRQSTRWRGFFQRLLVLILFIEGLKSKGPSFRFGILHSRKRAHERFPLFSNVLLFACLLIAVGLVHQRTRVCPSHRLLLKIAATIKFICRNQMCEIYRLARKSKNSDRDRCRMAL